MGWYCHLSSFPMNRPATPTRMKLSHQQRTNNRSSIIIIIIIIMVIIMIMIIQDRKERKHCRPLAQRRGKFINFRRIYPRIIVIFNNSWRRRRDDKINAGYVLCLYVQTSLKINHSTSTMKKCRSAEEIFGPPTESRMKEKIVGYS